MIAAQRILLEREMLPGPEVVHPQLRRPRLTRPGLPLVEEQHVRLHPTGGEDAGRQPQQRVDIELGQQPAPHGLPGAAFEQHVVGDDDRRPPVHAQRGRDVLDEVELLVGGRDPEVLPVVGDVIPSGAPVIGDHGDGRFLAERRIRQDHARVQPGRPGKRVGHLDRGRPVRLADAVQQHVHRGEPGRAVDEFGAGDGGAPERPALLGGEFGSVMRLNALIGREEEAAGAARRVVHGVGRPRLQAVDHRCDQ